MKLVSIKSIKPGDRIVFPIISSLGKKILSENTELTEFYITRILEMNIERIYIHDEKFDEVEATQPISPVVRNKALEVYDKMKKLISEGKGINEDEIKNVAKSIADEARASGIPFIIDNFLFTPEDSLALHAINTAILSVGIGLQMSYNHSQLCDLALAGFIHDFGRIFSKDDNDVVHVQKGFELLRNTSLLSIISIAVSFQHHESYNGSGFPREIKKEEISEFSRIVSVADFFDTMISGNNGRKLTYQEAYNLILNNSNIKFDPEIVKAFKNTIQIYYNGMQVVLNDGTHGIVIKQNAGKPLRPIIRLFSESDPSYSVDFDLLDKIDTTVQSVIL